LRKGGYEVTQASDGVEAIDKFIDYLPLTSLSTILGLRSRPASANLDKIIVASALAILENAGNAIDARSEEVLAALDFRAARATVKWPFDQYHNALATEHGELDVDKEGRRQVLHASLNGIKRVVPSP
jgi:hypothetical protein